MSLTGCFEYFSPAISEKDLATVGTAIKAGEGDINAALTSACKIILLLATISKPLSAIS